LTIRAVHQQHPLAGIVRASQHVTDFESDAEAGAGRIGHEQVAGFQPFDIPFVHLTLGQARFSRVHIVVEQVLRQHLVSVCLDCGDEHPQRRNRAAIASNGTSKIDFQA
jgi:hypothetical protein